MRCRSGVTRDADSRDYDRGVFTVERREDVSRRVIELGIEDDRVVAGAIVGSLAVDAGDAYSDLDLTFAVRDDVDVVEVLDDWSRTVEETEGAVALVDLERGPTTYRVFLLPDALQLDLSMAPAATFRPAGPRFRLLFGDTAPGDAPLPTGALFIETPARVRDAFGWGAIYALHARACIERSRIWQAEHYIGAVRDHALSLACLRAGVTPSQARGYDDLPAEVLEQVASSHVDTLEHGALQRALAAATGLLLSEGVEAGVPNAEVVAERLAELT